MKMWGGMLLAASLTACGGGGGGGDTSDALVNSATAGEVAANVVTAAEASSGSSSLSNDSYEVAAADGVLSTDASVASSSDTSSSLMSAQAVSASSSCYSLPAMPSVPSDALKVTDFGAVANDDLPDDAAISKALAALKPGQWLVFPPGRYIQSKSIYVNVQNAVLWGNGATIHATNPDDQSIQLAASGSSIYGFTLTAATDYRRTLPRSSRISIYPAATLTGAVSGNVVRRNTITYDASNPNGGSGGILVYRAKDFLVAENTVRRTLADGIHMTGGSYNGKVMNNTVRETGDDMIAVVSYLGSDWRTKVKSSVSAASALWGQRAHDIYIANNDVSGNYWGRGITVVGGANVTITNNAISKVTRAAGVLVGQEANYNTFGDVNILVTGNSISQIQTTTPAYVASTALAKLAATTLTGQAGIEVYNSSNSTSDATDALLKPYITTSGVMIGSNSVKTTIRDGLRMGSDTAEGLIGATSLRSNAFSGIKLKAINHLLASVSPSYCSGNTLDGAATGDASTCAATVEPVVTGASLSCTGALQ